MARNIEIKAYIESVEALTSKAAELADEGPIEISQDDTFFRCEAGRLKLQIFPDVFGKEGTQYDYPGIAGKGIVQTWR